MPGPLISLGELVTTEHRMDKRPILSIWYGHAEMTPQTLPPSIYNNNSLHETGCLQSILDRQGSAARFAPPCASWGLHGLETAGNDANPTGGLSGSMEARRHDTGQYGQKALGTSRRKPHNHKHSSDGHPQEGDLNLQTAEVVFHV